MQFPKPEKKTTKYDSAFTCFGLTLALMSGFMFSFVTVIVKYLKNIDTGQLAAYRFWAMASFSLPQLIYFNQHPLGPPGSRFMVVILALATATSGFLYFIAFRFLPIGEAAALISCYPALVAVSAKVFLSEPFGLLQLISLLTTLMGIGLISGVQQSFTDNSRVYTTDDIYGLSGAIASLIASTVVLTLLRKCNGVNSSVLLFSVGFAGTIQSSITTALIGNFSLSYRGLQQILLIILGFTSYLSMVTQVVAMQYAEAGPVSTLMAASEIFFSHISQVVIFGDTPDSMSILGAVLVSVSIVLVGLQKQMSAFLPKICLKF